jgi:hypothetical protein
MFGFVYAFDEMTSPKRGRRLSSRIMVLLLWWWCESRVWRGVSSILGMDAV